MQPATLPVGKITPSQVKALLRSRSSNVLIVDVRETDFAGGHIRGCINVPAHNFLDDNKVDELVDSCQGKDRVIVHCYLSQQRGPFCAQRLAARLGEAGGSSADVCVMAGGWRRFSHELSADDVDLVEDYFV